LPLLVCIVELWLLGEGLHDHFEKFNSEISWESVEQLKKLDFPLCAPLWQSMEPNNIFGILRTFIFINALVEG